MIGIGRFLNFDLAVIVATMIAVFGLLLAIACFDCGRRVITHIVVLTVIAAFGWFFAVLILGVMGIVE